MEHVHRLWDRIKAERRLPLIMQTEATECGLACMAMISSYLGQHHDLIALRERFSMSMRGSTLKELLAIARGLRLGARPLTLPLEELADLETPCILHWKFNHFVVLREVTARGLVIHDPSRGILSISFAEASKSFTGVAMELWPEPGFEIGDARARISLRRLFGKTHGMSAVMVQLIVLACGLELCQSLSPLFMQWILDKVFISMDRQLLIVMGGAFVILTVIQQLIMLARGWALIYFGTMFSVQWRSNLFSHLLRLPVEYFQKRHLGDIVSRFSSVDSIQRTLSTTFLEGILDGLLSVLLITIMLFYDKMMASIVCASMLIYFACRLAWYGPLRRAAEDQLIFSARQQTHFLESVRGVKPIKLFGREAIRGAAWLSLLVDQVNKDVSTQRLQLFYRIMNGLLFGIENVLVIWIGAGLVLDGNVTAGAFVAFLAYKSQFETKITSLIDNMFDLRMLGLQSERIADIALAKPEQTEPKEFVSKESIEPSIELDGISFRYADFEPFILRDLRLQVNAGECVAIIGPSGCGKTTLASLLSGVLTPTEGRILVGGREVSRIGVEMLRMLIGTVTQDDVLFAGSIRENISFFDQDVDFEWVKQCAEIASIHREIEAMPMAYNTLVGDMGTVLSGGQKQRILLARALYKKPKILILDEATSHLDLVREKMVSNEIKRLNVTRIIIAHRPETIASADRVISIANGRIVVPERSGLTNVENIARVIV